jgi:metal-responsive CopG/Arc/MetJ family transcriptional regulator
MVMHMRIGLSIPDDVFAAGERFARRAKISRSRLYSDAVREYVARRQDVTSQIDMVVAELARRDDPFVRSAAHRVLENCEW